MFYYFWLALLSIFSKALLFCWNKFEIWRSTLNVVWAQFLQVSNDIEWRQVCVLAMYSLTEKRKTWIWRAYMNMYNQVQFMKAIAYTKETKWVLEYDQEEWFSSSFSSFFHLVVSIYVFLFFHISKINENIQFIERENFMSRQNFQKYFFKTKIDALCRTTKAMKFDAINVSFMENEGFCSYTEFIYF